MAKREIEGQKEFLKVLWSMLVQKHLEPVIFRHVDLFTKGHPDSSVTANSKTLWFEFKQWDGVLSPSQEDNLKKMGNAWLVTFEADGRVTAKNLCLSLFHVSENFDMAARRFSLYF